MCGCDIIVNGTANFYCGTGCTGCDDYVLDTTIDFQGAIDTTTVSITLIKSGRKVVLSWENVYGLAISSDVISSVSSIPSDFLPLHDVNEIKWGSDNSSNKFVAMVLNTSGGITIGVGETQNAFTASGTCSMWSGSISYVSAS